MGWAANQPEAELIQGMLESAGIPSTWKRGGPDIPHLMAGGPRDIYVTQSQAAEAQTLLATRTEVVVPPPDPATQPVGLERTGIRLVGKLTAAIMVLGIGLTTLAIFVSPIAGLVFLVAAVVALVAWSEHS